METTRDDVRTARLALRGLVDAVLALDDDLRIAERAEVHDPAGTLPPLLPAGGAEEVQNMATAMVQALEVCRVLLRTGTLLGAFAPARPPRAGDECETADDLRAVVAELRSRLDFFDTCLAAVGITTEPVQASALPGLSFSLLSWDVRHAADVLQAAHFDLADRLKEAVASVRGG